MSTLVAIQYREGQASVVTANVSRHEPIDLIDIWSTALPRDQASRQEELTQGPALQDTAAEEAPNQDSAVQTESADDWTRGSAISEPFSQTTTHVSLLASHFEQVGLDFDQAYAIFLGKPVIYKRLSLPFRDQKRIDKIAPLQLQDDFPCAVESFIVDNVALGEQTNDPGQQLVLSALALEEEVAGAINSLNKLGADPMVLTTRASALRSLVALTLSESEEPLAVMETDDAGGSLVITSRGKVIKLRDFSFSPDSDGTLSAAIISQIKCSIAAAEEIAATKIHTLHLIASNAVFEQCQVELPLRVLPVALEQRVVNSTGRDLALDQYAWALGLFAQEVLGTEQSKNIIDFRKGKYAYHAAWTTLWAALKDELFYIVLAVLLALGWGFSAVSATQGSLNAVEEKIQALVAGAGIQESIPRRGELTFFESKIAELEDQLRQMGSLASLSPLESLRTLSEAIPREVDVVFDSVNIGFSRLVLRGTVPDNPSVGKLERLLQLPEKRFCEAKLEPGGRDSGSSRIRFSAEISVCE